MYRTGHLPVALSTVVIRAPLQATTGDNGIGTAIIVTHSRSAAFSILCALPASSSYSQLSGRAANNTPKSVNSAINKTDRSMILHACATLLRLGMAQQQQPSPPASPHLQLHHRDAIDRDAPEEDVVHRKTAISFKLDLRGEA